MPGANDVVNEGDGPHPAGSQGNVDKLIYDTSARRNKHETLFQKTLSRVAQILLGIILLQSGLIWFTLSQATDLTDLVSDVQSILIIFFFAVFVYMIVIIQLCALQAQEGFQSIGNLIEEIRTVLSDRYRQQHL
jgi:hypothetical protein